MKIYAYAKINLRLKCIEKLQNGYHELEMINSKVKIRDTIYIRKSKNNKLKFSNKFLNEEKDNLVLKILEYFQTEYDIKEKYYIYIKKRIPIGAGLGGGSSDAAAIMNFLNKHHKLNLTIEELEEIGKLFGADIPYCLHNEMAVVRGIGEKVEILNDSIKDKIIVYNPGVNICTKDVFEINNSYSKMKEIKHFDYSLIENDLELAASKLCPQLIDIKKRLNELNIVSVVMSGSGSSFVIITKEENSKKVYKQIKKEFKGKVWYGN